MRKNVNLRGKRGNVGMELTALARVYLKEFVLMSDYLYYASLLEGEYGDLSAMFDFEARDRIDLFKNIGKTILNLGGTPQVNMQRKRQNLLGNGKISGNDIERVLRYLMHSERETLAIYEKLSAFSENEDITNIASECVFDKRELIERFECMLRS